LGVLEFIHSPEYTLSHYSTIYSKYSVFVLKFTLTRFLL